MTGPRYENGSCLDCGAAIANEAAHTRFHSILSAQAWALAVLQTGHIAAHVHDRYEIYDKIKSKRFDSWSADALAEVAGENGGSENLQVKPGSAGSTQ